MNTRFITLIFILFTLVFCQASPVFPADDGLMGKNGETTPYTTSPDPQINPGTRTAIEYSTTGVLDTPATHGGDLDGWGSHFIARWHNTTGEDVSIVEFAWPCAGFWITSWYVWISETLPGPPGTQDFRGDFLAANEDGTAYPPSPYTYIDVADEGIVIPAGSTMFFGYANPGMGGQVPANGVETWSYYEDAWDADSAFNRTAILQFKAEFSSTSNADPFYQTMGTPPVASPNPFNPKTTISFDVPKTTRVDLSIHDLRGHLVKNLAGGILDQGHYELNWNGLNNQGQALASGTYFVRLVSNGTMEQSKIALIR